MHSEQDPATVPGIYRLQPNMTIYHVTCRTEERMGYNQRLKAVRGHARKRDERQERCERRANVGESHQQGRQNRAPELDRKFHKTARSRRHTLSGLHGARGLRVERRLQQMVLFAEESVS